MEQMIVDHGSTRPMAKHYKFVLGDGERSYGGGYSYLSVMSKGLVLTMDLRVKMVLEVIKNMLAIPLIWTVSIVTSLCGLISGTLVEGKRMVA